MTTSPAVVAGSEPAEDRPGRRLGHGPAWWLGWVLVVGGLAVLGYVAWQLVGTNVVAERRQHTITDGLHRAWQRGHDTARVAGVEAGAVVRIPRFGDDFAVPVVQGVGDRQLASGFGHVPGTARVGQVGNYALAAHRVTHGQPLRRMPELRAGDRVVVETRTRVYTYVLDTGGDDVVVPFTAVWVLGADPVDPSGRLPELDSHRLLTLTTCSELFHTDDRMVAFGHLTGVRER